MANGYFMQIVAHGCNWTATLGLLGGSRRCLVAKSLEFLVLLGHECLRRMRC